MTKSIALTLWALLTGFFSLHAQEVEHTPMTYTKVSTYSAEDLREVWKKYNIPEMIAPLNNGVDLYSLEYSSCTVKNCKVKASGLFLVPKGVEQPPVVLFHHGTRVLKGQMTQIKGTLAIGFSFAADGYAVLVPDYIGLGTGEGRHLYLHSETEAQASIDMLRAVRKLAPEMDLQLGEQLFLTGYSQGGHATMATHKYMQEEFGDEFTVTASSPMSGPYDLYGVQGADMFEVYDWPSYLPFLMLSYQNAYHFFDDPSEVFLPPYDTLLPPLFDGSMRLADIDSLLPEVPTKMIRPEVIHAYEADPDFPFRKALKQNSLYDWKPEAPVQLCYCKSDEAVNYRNSVKTYEIMRDKGAESVYLRHAGRKFGHVNCALFTTIYTKWFFDSYRDGKQKKWKGPLGKRMLVGMFKARIPGLKKQRRQKARQQRKEQARKSTSESVEN